MLICTVGALLVTAHAAGQPVVGGPDFHRFRIGGDLNRYEAHYGEPETRTLDEDPAMWPQRRSIRTVGPLGQAPRWDLRQGDDEEPRSLPHAYALHGRHSLALSPVQDIADLVAVHAPYWLGREVEVVGAWDEGAFLVWSMLVLPEQDDDGFTAPRSSLEALVMDPDAAAGQVVTVTGTFRGGNLLDELPDDSRRHAQDWVLSDGPFFVWVTGMKPEGDGFSLDLRSRSDLRWELAVQGEVETHDGFIYLRAERIRLVGPARDESDSDAR